MAQGGHGELPPLGGAAGKGNPRCPHPANPTELCKGGSASGVRRAVPGTGKGQRSRGRKITAECWPGSQRDIWSEAGDNFAHKLGVIAAALLRPGEGWEHIQGRWRSCSAPLEWEQGEGTALVSPQCLVTGAGGTASTRLWKSRAGGDLGPFPAPLPRAGTAPQQLWAAPGDSSWSLYGTHGVTSEGGGRDSCRKPRRDGEHAEIVPHLLQ